jgi:hypothetical protein
MVTRNRQRWCWDTCTLLRNFRLQCWWQQHDQGKQVHVPPSTASAQAETAWDSRTHLKNVNLQDRLLDFP